MSRQLHPTSIEEAARTLSEAAADGETVRILGSGTKLSWGASGREQDSELHTRGLCRLVEHNEGDLTAVLEAGVPVAVAQEKFASAGQMLALDPWLGSAPEATIGGVLATADSGPLRHRYGAPRDLVLGMTVVLSDGNVARSGGKVIKNVAGYDLAKLFCGSFGTLGLIGSISVRLHPRPLATATAVGATGDPVRLAEAARGLAAAPLELECLDFSCDPNGGMLLAQCGGTRAMDRARRAAEAMGRFGLTGTDVTVEDESIWAAQRAGQRSIDGALIRVATRPSRLEQVLSAVGGSAASAVGRASLGHCFIRIEPEAFHRLIEDLPEETIWTLADAPESLRMAVDPWGSAVPEPVLDLMRRVKARFDPTGTCNRGLFVAGI